MKLYAFKCDIHIHGRIVKLWNDRIDGDKFMNYWLKLTDKHSQYHQDPWHPHAHQIIWWNPVAWWRIWQVDMVTLTSNIHSRSSLHNKYGRMCLNHVSDVYVCHLTYQSIFYVTLNHKTKIVLVLHQMKVENWHDIWFIGNNRLFSSQISEDYCICIGMTESIVWRVSLVPLQHFANCAENLMNM